MNRRVLFFVQLSVALSISAGHTGDVPMPRAELSVLPPEDEHDSSVLYFQLKIEPFTEELEIVAQAADEITAIGVVRWTGEALFPPTEAQVARVSLVAGQAATIVFKAYVRAEVSPGTRVLQSVELSWPARLSLGHPEGSFRETKTVAALVRAPWQVATATHNVTLD